MLQLFKSPKPQFLTSDHQQQIVNAIQEAEKTTSGEIRVYIESKCVHADAIQRAKELFTSLKMTNTAERNAVLVYIAVTDRKLAIWGDEGIHQQLGTNFWENSVQQLLLHFNKQDYATGLVYIITAVGEALKTHFPYKGASDVNELSDDIVFGD